MTKSGRHIAADDLAAYFDLELPEESLVAVEEHLAACADCAELAREVFGGLGALRTWTAGSHAEANLAFLVRESLTLAEVEANIAWRRRLQEWRVTWQSRGQGAVRVVLGRAGRMSQIVTEGLDALTNVGGWHFAVATAGRGIGDVAAVAYHGGEVLARVDASGSGGFIEGTVINIPETVLPLVLLVDLTNQTIVRLGVVERRGNAGVARFEGLPAGEYLILFEPAGTEDFEATEH